MKKKFFLVLLAVIVVLLAAGGGVSYYLYSHLSRPVVSSEDCTLTYHDDGTVRLEWPAPLQGGNAIRLYIYDVSRMDYDFLGEYAGNAAELTGLDTSQNYVLKMEAVKYTSLPFMGDREIVSEDGRTLLVYARQMHSPEISSLTNPSDTTATLYWDAESRLSYEVYSVEGNVYTGVMEAAGGNAVIRFGEDRPIPENGSPDLFSVRASYAGTGYRIYSDFSSPVSIDRQDLLPLTLKAEASPLTDRSFTITWNETRGIGYEVQKLDGDGAWKTMAGFSLDQDRSYTTGTLPSGRDATFRIVSLAEDGSTTAATPAEITVEAGISSTYCTIWPVKDLPLCSDAALTTTLATVPAMTALCVIGESGSAFHVMYKGQFGYIASSFCMIDLEDYLGDLCLYDITNSYSSIFNAHKYPIKDLTDSVVTGYSHVRKADGTFLVPYLYPCAQKLKKAAESAAEEGYIFRIYDAFRPNEATRMMYDTASLILDDPVLDDVSGLSRGIEGDAQEGETYAEFMTDHGRYSLGNFLASRASYHNFGIALDMTLVYADSGEEAAMQTGMHDLSWYSEVSRNNDNANTLRRIMVDAGFGTLSSEWWHFQDTDTKTAIGLNTYVTQGASPEGWVLDDTGWKYRTEDGTFVTGTSREIDGETVTFDRNGYRTDSSSASQN